MDGVVTVVVVPEDADVGAGALADRRSLSVTGATAADAADAAETADCVVVDGDEVDVGAVVASVRADRADLPVVTVGGGSAAALAAYEAGATDHLPGEAAPDLVADRVEHAVEPNRAATVDRERKITTLHEVATDIEAAETSDEAYEELVAAAEDVLGHDLAVADAREGDVLVPRAVASDISGPEYYDRTPVDAEDNLAARAARRGEPDVVDDVRELSFIPADFSYRAVLTVPIGDYGVFQAVDREPGAFDETDLELAELLIGHVRTTLDRIERERELERQNERLEQFASLVSHDLRNPLNVASANLDLAREEVDAEPLAEVDTALDRMGALIEDVLTWAREGQAVEETEPVELGSVAERCWTMLSTDAGSLRVDADVTVEADPARLRRVLENLFRNAVEHGSTDVTVELGVLEDGDGFYVADDGPGVPEDEREAVFEMGYSHADGGTGFGLAIVAEIAAAHDWSVDLVESEAGGARFEFEGVRTVGDGGQD